MLQFEIMQKLHIQLLMGHLSHSFCCFTLRKAISFQQDESRDKSEISPAFLYLSFYWFFFFFCQTLCYSKNLNFQHILDNGINEGLVNLHKVCFHLDHDILQFLCLRSHSSLHVFRKTFLNSTIQVKAIVVSILYSIFYVTFHSCSFTLIWSV